MFNKRLLEYFKLEMKDVYKIVLNQWFILCCHIILTSIHCYVLTRLFNKQNIVISVYFVSVIVLLFVKAKLQNMLNKQAFVLSETIKNKLREIIFDKIYHQKRTTVFKESALTQLTTEGVDQLEIYFSKYIPQFYYALLAPITLFIIISFMSIKIALILLICVPLIPVSIIIVQKIAKKLLNKYWNSYNGLADSFLENLQGLTTLKYYQSDLLYQDKMDREAEDFRKRTMRVLIMQLNSISVMDLVAYGGYGIGVILALNAYFNNSITFFMFIFIVMIASEFFLPLRILGSYFHIGQNGNEAANKIFKLLDSESDIEDSYLDDIEEISFNNVSFGYDHELILKDISFKINTGQFVTVVGKSGSGKSTIASLIMNLYSINKGSIQYNKQEINNTTTLYQKITLIKDETYILKGSVYDHLLMSGCNDRDRMIEVLKLVHLYDYFNEYEGLEFQLLEGAKNLSGGQRQRLALARAILHDSDVYVFDEATNNVDSESENIILDIMQNLAKDKIVLMITHRMAHCMKSNKTMVMQEGKLLAFDSYSDLLKSNNYFKELVEQQERLERILSDER